MSTGIWAAASGATAQTAALDIAANNVANATTPGFRADRNVFRQELARALDQSAGTRSLRYSAVRSVEPDLRTGTVVHTGEPLDVSIASPDGWFAVRTPAGDRYTRAGSFRLDPDGHVVTRDGHAVLGPDRRPLQVPGADKPVAVDPRGFFTVDGEQTNARLLVVTFRDPRGLEKEGDVLLRARPEAGPARTIDVPIDTETLELSNASALSGMTELVTTSRQFEMLTRVIEAFSQADRRAATDLIKAR